MKKILIMGLPGAGKTHLATRLREYLECAWYNADSIRSMANDWDFSAEGRARQAQRMRNLADFEKSHGRVVICDFVCPTTSTRSQFAPDIIIWVDTINEGRFDDTNKMFEPPTNAHYHLTHFLSDLDIKELSTLLKIEIDKGEKNV